MPGVLGVISKRVVDDGLIERMVTSLKHENWYKIDKYTEEFFAIVRVHLGIFNPIPQPIFNEDRTLCIFMDGKIYDYTQKINELKRNGHQFSSSDDPDFCLHSYEEYGDKFIKELNGAFFMAIYDFKNNRLLIANDRYGFLPHYYTVTNDEFLFAPEVKAILQAKSVKRELNDEAVTDFFAFGEFFGDKTFFKGINILPPASILTYDGGGVSVKQYFRFEYRPDYNITEEEFVNRLVIAFKKAVEIRMRDNYRYCVSLSGGLDSRSIVAAIGESRSARKRNEPKRRDNYAFTFGPSDSDEVKIAQKIAKQDKMKFLHIDITPDFIIDNAEQEVWLTDGRDYIGVSFTYPAYKSISEVVDVVFDGYELDVILGGSYSSRKVSSSKSEEELRQRLLKHRLFSDEEFSELFSPNYYYKIRDFALKSFKKEFDEAKSEPFKNKCDNFFLRTHVAYVPIGEVLSRNALELSFPTMDNEFIDVVLKIPPEFRLNHRIYRKFLEKLSPKLANIPYNKTMVPPSAPLFLWKIGMIYQFGKERVKKLIWRLSKGKIFLPNKRSYVNFDEWFRTNTRWQNYFTGLLLSENTLSKRYFNQEYIRYLILEHIKGKRDNSLKILYLATFELFLRQFEIE